MSTSARHKMWSSQGCLFYIRVRFISTPLYGGDRRPVVCKQFTPCIYKYTITYCHDVNSSKWRKQWLNIALSNNHWITRNHHRDIRERNSNLYMCIRSSRMLSLRATVCYLHWQMVNLQFWCSCRLLSLLIHMPFRRHWDYVNLIQLQIWHYIGHILHLLSLMVTN